MEWFDKIAAIISGNEGTIGTIAVVVLEVVLRLWPSDRIRSLLSYAGRLLLGVGKVVYALSDMISKFVPDRPATPEPPK